MVSWVDYRGMQVPDVSTGEGGENLTANFQELANRAAKTNFTATGNPGPGDDVGDGYYPGSLWVNTSGQTIWICISNGSGAAVWQQIGSSGVSDGDKGDITVSSSGATWTIDNNVVNDAKLRDSAALSVIGRSTNSSGDPADMAAANDGEVLRRSGTSLGFGTIATAGIADDQVTFAKIQNITSQRLIGRQAASSGDATEITVAAGSNVSLDWSTTNTLTISSTGGGGISDGDKGDITVSGSGTVWTIDNDVVTYAKMQNVSATDKILGRSTAGAGDVEEIACSAAARSILDDSSLGAMLSTYGISRSNAIMNGDFQVWQRGTAFSSLTGAATNAADRWATSGDRGTSGTGTYALNRQAFTLGQTDVPNEPKYYLEFSTSSLSTGTNSYLYVYQSIEDVRTLAGQSVTLSFFAKASSSASLGVLFLQKFGSGGSPSGDVQSGTTKLSLTTSWQRFTVGFTVPSISGKAIGTTDFTSCLRLYFVFEDRNNLNGFSSGFTALTSGSYAISDAQLESGGSASPFQRPVFANSLASCQRYYEKSHNYATVPSTAGSSDTWDLYISSNSISNAQIYGRVPYKVAKRIAPSVTTRPYTTPSNTGRVSNGGGTDLASGSGQVGVSNEQSFLIYNGSGGSLTTSGNFVIFNWEADAEY